MCSRKFYTSSESGGGWSKRTKGEFLDHEGKLQSRSKGTQSQDYGAVIRHRCFKAVCLETWERLKVAVWAYRIFDKSSHRKRRAHWETQRGLEGKIDT